MHCRDWAAMSPGATVAPSASSGHAPAAKTKRAGPSVVAAYAYGAVSVSAVDRTSRTTLSGAVMALTVAAAAG